MGKTIENPHIRISVHAKATLRELALHEGKPMQAVLDEAIEHYQRERLLDEANAALRAVEKRPESLEGRTRRARAVGRHVGRRT